MKKTFILSLVLMGTIGGAFLSKKLFASGMQSIGSGGTTYSQGTNISISGATIATTASPTFATSVTSPAYTSSTANPAAAGVVRLANTDNLSWRNAAANADLAMTVNASNYLTWPNTIYITGTYANQFVAPARASNTASPTYAFDNGSGSPADGGMGYDSSNGYVYLRAGGTTGLVQEGNADIKLNLKLTLSGNDLVRVTNIGESGGGGPVSVLRVDSIILPTAGDKLQIKEGTNAAMGQVTCNGATTAVTVNTTSVTANSRIFISMDANGGGAPTGPAYVSSRVAGTSFAIKCGAADTTTLVNWMLTEAL